MTYYVGTMPVGEHLSHHGIKGMKWGQRRYQNPDGSLTAAGRARYGVWARRAIGVAAGVGAAALGYKYRKQLKGVAKIAGSRARKVGSAMGSTIKRKARISREVNSAFRGARSAGKKAGSSFLSRTMDAGAKAGRRARIGAQVDDAFKASRKARSGVKKASFLSRTMDAGAKAGRRARIGAQVDDAFKTGSRAKRDPWIVRGVEDSVRKNVPRRLAKLSAASRVKQRTDAIVRKAQKLVGRTKASAPYRYAKAAKNKAKTAYAKGVVATRGTKAYKGAKKVVDSAARKRRISKDVNSAFNSTSRYLGTHTRKQIRRDVARNLGLQVGAAYAGAGAGAYITRRKKKKSRK